ncbi:MAG: hypothetical protein AAF485_24635, partial [Chloroflexota bacterium]
KSLLLQQMALLAYQQGRTVHLFQWDVVRQPFETHDYVLEHYPEIDGVTHAMVRKAAGLWIRQAVGAWYQAHPEETHLLVGEAPLIGGRFMELARSQTDFVEAFLSDPQTTFATVIPSIEIRHLIEGRREASSANPQHEREQADAIPVVMRDSWMDIYNAGAQLGLNATAQHPYEAYEPDIYQGVYQHLLKHRQRQPLMLDIKLETAETSVYDLGFQPQELIPHQEDVLTYLADAEQRYPDATALQQASETWYQL